MQMRTRTPNRWLVAMGGILIQLCLGAIYAWSAFTHRLTQAPFDFTRTQTQLVFSLGLVSFAVVMALVAGRWQARSGPRVVAATGGLVLGLGYVIAGLSGNSFLGLLLGIGLLGGAGIGLAYVCPIAALVKWFPDRKGFITGLAVAGFGFGALIWIKLTSGFRFGPIDLTPGWGGLFGDGWSINSVFILYGVLFALIVGVGSIVLVDPPKGWKPAHWEPAMSKTPNSGDVDYTTRQMLRTPQYWTLFLTFAFGATAGLMVIGVIRLYGMDQLEAAGMEPERAAIVTGTAMGLFYALFNGIGRIAWGWASEWLGRRLAIALMGILQGAMMITFYFIGGTEWGLYLGAAVIGFNFGGNFALFPAATADYFGNKSVGTNYPWIFLAYGVGGLVGPYLGGSMGDAMLWQWAFIPAGIACFAGAGLMLMMKAPEARAASTAGQISSSMKSAA